MSDAQTITITLHVDAAAAVRERRACAGPQRLHVGEAELAALSGEEIDTLARHVGREPGWGEPLHLGVEPLARADLAALRRCLVVRRFAMFFEDSGHDVVAWLHDDRPGRPAPYVLFDRDQRAKAAPAGGVRRR